MKYTPELLYKFTGLDGAPYHGGVGRWGLPDNGKPGKWFKVKGELEPCDNGLHLCRSQDLVQWCGPELYVAEYKGRLVECDDKVVVRQARLLERVASWNERITRLFACDCAERALGLVECPDERSIAAVGVTRRFADGLATHEELNAARAAASDAASDAARAAARDAASDAAWNAAWAASDAASGAARAASWNAKAAWAARAASWNAKAAWAASGAAVRAAACHARDATRNAAWAASGAAWAARNAARNAAWAAAWAVEREWQTDRLLFYLNGEGA